MKEIDELNIPENAKYTKDHEWARIDGGTAVIGINDYAQDQLGEVVYVELPEIGDSFEKGEEFGTVESVKAVSEIYMPLSGEVIEFNEALADSPELVNSDPYGDGWIIKIKPSDVSEMDQLMDKTAYFAMLKG